MPNLMRRGEHPHRAKPIRKRVSKGSHGLSVLIIGDWFVDEHWVVGVHRSSSSSRTGQAHYRALHPIGSEVRAFCGAGRSAFVLHHIKGKDGGLLFSKLVGLGFWHREDTGALQTLFNPAARAHSPNRLLDRSDGAWEPDGVRLINMHDSFFRGRRPQDRDKHEFTNRIIRIYRRGAGDNVWYERFDWEPPLRPVAWDPARLRHLREKVREELGHDHVDVVVIKDLLKGAVTPDIVRWLAADVGKSARWYVSSKKWKPDWLDVLRSVDLKLLLVPEVAAHEAMTTEKDLSCWLTPAGSPSREALRQVERLQAVTRGTGEECAIIVLAGGATVLCRAPDPDGRPYCIVQPDDLERPPHVPMGGQSIFFPALSACMEYSRRVHRKWGMDWMIKHALNCTYEWIDAEGKRVTEPKRWDPSPASWRPNPTLLDISTMEKVPPQQFNSVDQRPWDDETMRWRQAMSIRGLGIVDETNIDEETTTRQLQLWRSTVEVDGYVCYQRRKRQQLRYLVQGIREFAAHPKSHAACMLIAAPGSGKTFLINQLAGTALRFIPFNLTQLSSRSDVLNWFDTILVRQAENPLRPLLVFVDEINADLDGSPIYSAFLAPLEEGLYVRGGQTFHISPCMWVFAGTEAPDRGRDKRSQKGSDFVSRLSLGIVDLRSSISGGRRHIENEQLLERIYQGGFLLRREFPDVRRVSEFVLRAFRDLPQGTRVRDIMHFVKRFSYIQYDRVTSANVPRSWPGDTRGRAFAAWNEAVELARARGKKERADIELITSRRPSGSVS